jgi:hypothetical protein
MYTTLTSVMAASGLWDGTRKQSHGFLLSPSVYRITEAQHQELKRLGFALYDCLSGLSHIAVIAYDTSLNYRGAWMRARNVFSTGVPSIYQELQGSNVRHLPKLLKVDLMVDQMGNFRIAEIDGHNKHGLGYSTLARRFREALYPDAVALPGAVQALATMIKSSGRRHVKLLYADQERFYLPEFAVARQEFARHDVECSIVGEMQVTESFLEEGLFIDLPFLNQRTNLYQHVLSAYRSGAVEFIIPPKPFLGAKGVMALLRNDEQDEEIEALLRTFIKKTSLELVRRLVPETVLVGRKALGFDAVKTRAQRKRFVLKESISSGMKGTVFSDSESFDAVLQVACKTNLNWILQEEVANDPQTFSWFENGSGDPVLKTSNDWFMRVTAHYVQRDLADIIVTARRDKAVHGAKDSIQISTTIA